MRHMRSVSRAIKPTEIDIHCTAYMNCVSDLFANAKKLFVAFFDLFVEGLVLSLELLKVHEVQAVCKLIARLQLALYSRK